MILTRRRRSLNYRGKVIIKSRACVIALGDFTSLSSPRDIPTCNRPLALYQAFFDLFDA